MNKTEQRKIRIELNAAVLLLSIVSGCVFCITAHAQTDFLHTEHVKTLAQMSPLELFALIAILALLLCSYLIRLLFGRLLQALDSNTKSNADLAKLLAERPCIRRKEND